MFYNDELDFCFKHQKSSDLTDGSAETDTCLTMSMREILDRSWENEGNHGSHGNNGNHGSHAAINALLKSNGITSDGTTEMFLHRHL